MLRIYIANVYSLVQKLIYIWNGKVAAKNKCSRLWGGEWITSMLCLRSEDAFVITWVVKVLYVQQDLRYEISSYWRFNV
jgi:hypothetical protein